MSAPGTSLAHTQYADLIPLPDYLRCMYAAKQETKKFAKVLGLTSVAVFGGSGVANQISELKRGTEVVACTPGRMIDLLVTGAGKITNLRR